MAVLGVWNVTARVQDFVRIFENGGYGANGAATWTNQDAYTETYK
jgi:hypothetical protein